MINTQLALSCPLAPPSGRDCDLTQVGPFLQLGGGQRVTSRPFLMVQ